jgi:hypothetical protein
MNGYPRQHADRSPTAAIDSARQRSVHNHPEFRSMRRAIHAFGAATPTPVPGGSLPCPPLSSFVPGGMDRAPSAGRH